MGTNYYRIKEIPKEKRKAIHDMLDSVLDRLAYKWALEEKIEEVDKEHRTHICKTSFGWQVCFDHNWGKYYQPNRKSLEQFLKEPNTHIEDEYGQIISPEEFWNIVDAHNSNPRNSWTSKTYEEYEEKVNGRTFTKYGLVDIEQCKMFFGIDTHGETDFMVDGLRFAVYSDFR